MYRCPMCAAHGLDTESEYGPDAVRVSIDSGNTAPLIGVLCRECRLAGVVSEADIVRADMNTR